MECGNCAQDDNFAQEWKQQCCSQVPCIRFLPFPTKMVDEHKNINQSNLHNNMSTKDPIKAAVKEVIKCFENSKQSEADKESLKSLVIRKLLEDCNYDVCDSDLQGNKSKFKWFSGFIWCVMILIYSFYLCAEAWWHTRFLLSTSVFLHSSHLKLSVCCAFLCRSMIKCFPAFITCALLAPFDVVFIVFLPFEVSATCFALALCKDPSIKVLSTIVPFVSSPKNWTLLVTCPMYDVIWLSKFDEINFAVSNVWFLDELNCHFFATPSPLPLLSLPTNPRFKTEMIT